MALRQWCIRTSSRCVAVSEHPPTMNRPTFFDSMAIPHLIAFRLLAERRHEYRQPLYAAYIDLRDAFKFDSLDRNSLWNILKTMVYHQNCFDSIKIQYSSTHSVVRENGTISEAFSIPSGVRQGCVLSAYLF